VAARTVAAASEPTAGSPTVRPDVGCWVVATFSSVTQQHILQALAEYDTRGGQEFLDVYGFVASGDHPLVHEGRSYDSRAVLGVAHRFATGRIATPEEVESGFHGAVAILRRRGFTVSEPPVAPRGPVRATRAPRTTAPRASAAGRTATRRVSTVPERTPTICPTCSMTLPATGVCDNCS
jgi:hypothetical protein